MNQDKKVTIGELTFREVELPFRDEMWEAVLEYGKDRTSRNKNYGKGNVFLEPGRSQSYIITDVRKHKLDYVAYRLYRFEGFDSPEDFIAYWKMIHPRKGYEPEQQVFVHSFEHIYPNCVSAYKEFAIDPQTTLDG